jgi:hypothetical protein
MLSFVSGPFNNSLVASSSGMFGVDYFTLYRCNFAGATQASVLIDGPVAVPGVTSDDSLPNSNVRVRTSTFSNTGGSCVDMRGVNDVYIYNSAFEKVFCLLLFCYCLVFVLIC